MSDVDEGEVRTHYHFRISLRVRHPTIDPQTITEAVRIKPKRSWMAGERRQTSKGTPLAGSNPDTYWSAEMAAGRWPSGMNEAVHDALRKLGCHRSFLHHIRAEGGAVEFLIGWFLENQSGGTLAHECLALAGDLQVDLSFDIYPPDQPQHEYESSRTTSRVTPA